MRQRQRERDTERQRGGRQREGERGRECLLKDKDCKVCRLGEYFFKKMGKCVMGIDYIGKWGGGGGGGVEKLSFVKHRQSAANVLQSYFFSIYFASPDVITLHGYILTEPPSYVDAAMFNTMGLMVSLPVVMERRLATINKNMTHNLRASSPLVRDVITFIKRVG